jgi:hypothetical protein
MHSATNSKAANGGHAIVIKVSDGANEQPKAVALLWQRLHHAPPTDTNSQADGPGSMQPTANSDTGDVRPRRILYTK